MALRALVLSEEPLCGVCLAHGRTTASAEVDHILALEDGGTDDRDNLQGICVDCHKIKHGATPRVGVDGWPMR
jgi:5-methylcytosine-specific restriction enzyme A